VFKEIPVYISHPPRTVREPFCFYLCSCSITLVIEAFVCRVSLLCATAVANSKTSIYSALQQILLVPTDSGRHHPEYTL
jgi:hypothetical protein